MIDKDKFLQFILEKSEKLSIGDYLDIRTYKRNRGLYFIKNWEDKFYIIENWYYQEEFEINKKDLKKTFKKLLKKEFPRSNKIRVYEMGKYSEEKIENTNFKKL